MERKNNRKLSAAEAVLLLVISIAILMWGVLKAQTPTAMSLMISGAICAFYGYAVLHQKWDDIFERTMKIVAGAMPALYFLMFTGAVSAAWIASGTIPYIIYVGLGIIRPQIFLFAALLITALTSFCTGSSWAIIASVGLALAGIGQGLGIPPALTAGCVVSGCFMGDKWSPLSDSCNLVAATSGQKSVDVSKSMLATTGLSLVISLVLYLIIGFKYGSGADISEIAAYISQLGSSFHMSVLTLLPLLFFSAVFFAGSAEAIGIIDVVVKLLTKVIRGPGSLVSATAATCIGIVFLTSSDYTSIILNNRLYEGTCKKLGVGKIVLSRTVAESTTTIGAICPWNSSAMVASAAVGVSAFAYAPFSFPTWIAIILAIVFAFTGKFTLRIPAAAQAEEDLGD